jgi:tetratricopeptide (TPR) repeat protein
VTLARQEKRLPQELGNLSMRGLTRFYDGSVQDALEDEHESIRLAARYGNLRAEMSGYVDLALIYLYTNQIDEAEQAARRGLELARRLGAARFFGDNLVAIGEALVLKGRREEGLQFIEHAYQAALDSVPTHVAPFILGVMARLTTDEERSSWAITEGQRYLDQGSLSHNYLHFYQNLIEIALNREDPESALEYAARLETYTAPEPLAWSDFYIARGRLLAQALQRPVDEVQRQQAEALIEKARIAGLYFGVTGLQAVATGNSP